MQDDIRNATQIPSMINFIKNGGIWSLPSLTYYANVHNVKTSPLIEIASFPDGMMMIHDGHHRAVATYLGGRKFLHPEELRIKEWNYSNYLGINFATKWVTPFDPRTHVRNAEIFVFKSKVFDVLQKEGKDKAVDFVKNSVYTKPREIYYLPDLAEKYEQIQTSSN
jgi:hypothetical protein